MNIVIFHRKSKDNEVSRFCLAELIAEDGKNVAFSTNERIPPALDSHYYVKTKEGEPATFREIQIYQHPAVRPPYTYTTEMGPEVRAFVAGSPDAE